MKTLKNLETPYERYILNRARSYGYNRVGLCAALGISQGTLKSRLSCRREWLPTECRKLAEILHLTDIELLYLTYYRVPLDDNFAHELDRMRACTVFAKVFIERFPEYAAEIDEEDIKEAIFAECTPLNETTLTAE